MEIKTFIIFAIIILILFLVVSNHIIRVAIKQNKVKKGSALRYMIISVFSGIVIVSFSIWTFFIH